MSVARVLRLEGLAMAAGAIALFTELDVSWWLFAALILAPDVAFAAYAAGPRLGAVGYNLTHNLVLAVGLGAIGVSPTPTSPRRSRSCGSRTSASTACSATA